MNNYDARLYIDLYIDSSAACQRESALILNAPLRHLNIRRDYNEVFAFITSTDRTSPDTNSESSNSVFQTR